MPATYLELFGADLSENELFQCVSILLTGTSTGPATYQTVIILTRIGMEMSSKVSI